MNPPSTSIEFESSILGTQDYWDDFYQKEIDILKLNENEFGEVWFGEQTQQTTIDFLLEKFDSFTCIDIGCGNGLFCIELMHQKNNDQSIQCIGLDYSEQSIQLAKLVESKYNNNNNSEQPCAINWKCCNFLEMDLNSLLCETIRKDTKIVFHDKGTFDAISLHENKTLLKQQYKQQISKIMMEQQTECYFFITSCNYASNELKKEFENLQVVEEIDYPVFEFGGSKGSSVVSILFGKK